jgi:hypothetical protein
MSLLSRLGITHAPSSSSAPSSTSTVEPRAAADTTAETANVDERSLLQRIRDLPGVYTVGTVGAALSTVLRPAVEIMVQARTQQLPRGTISFTHARLEMQLLGDLKGTGPLTGADAQRLVDIVQRGSLPSDRVLVVVEQLQKTRGLSSEAIALLQPVLAPDDSVPTPRAKDSSQHKMLAPLQAPLFVQVDPTDVQQGQLGDCYLASSAAAIAMRAPNFFKDVVTEHTAPDGERIFRVHLHSTVLMVPTGAQDFTVPDSLWHSAFTIKGKLMHGDELYASSKPGAWFPVLEAAWVKHRGGTSYDAAASGYGSFALAGLTGRTAGFFPMVKATPPALVLEELQRHWDRGDAMTTGSRSNPDPAFLATHKGDFVKKHEFAILDVTGTNTQNARIKLYNPWGTTLELTLHEYIANFDSFSFVRMPTENGLPADKLIGVPRGAPPLEMVLAPIRIPRRDDDNKGPPQTTA